MLAPFMVRTRQRNLGVATLQRKLRLFWAIGKPNPRPPKSEIRTSLLIKSIAGQFVCADCRTSSGKMQAAALFALYALATKFEK